MTAGFVALFSLALTFALQPFPLDQTGTAPHRQRRAQPRRVPADGRRRAPIRTR